MDYDTPHTSPNESSPHSVPMVHSLVRFARVVRFRWPLVVAALTVTRDNATLTIEAPATQRFPFDKFRDLQTWETVVKSGQELPVRLTMKAAATPDAAKPDAPK